MPIVIEGNVNIPQSDFEPKIDKCLKLLQEKSAARYGYLNSNIKKIVAHTRSGADVQRSNINIAKATFDASETWLASVLVHESIHIWQKKEGKDYIGVKAEQECNAIQLEVLQAVNAPTSELDHLLSQTGDHADLDGDGDYDWDDYRLRKY